MRAIRPRTRGAADECVVTIDNDSAPRIMFYGEDNKAAAKFPNGTAPKATWSTKGNELCTAWDDQPNNPWSSYVKVGDKINVINSETKQVRGTVVRVVPGNAEKL